MGVYDTLYVDTGNYTYENNFHDKYSRSRSYNFYSDNAQFQYKITNNNFKELETPIEVNLYKDSVRVLTLHDSVITIEPFGSALVEWEIARAELIAGQNYMLKIGSEEYQRTVYIKFNTRLIKG